MKRLPSGTRYGPRLPVAAVNSFSPVLRALGLFPKVSDIVTRDAVTGDACALDAWVDEARRIRLRSFDCDAGLSLFGALIVKKQAKRSLKNSIEFDRLIARHPEIAQEKIDRPVFVIGWPRTGTTVVQRMLSLHQKARCLRAWEAYSPLREEDGRALSDEERYRAAKRALQLLHWVAPDLNLIHPMECDDPDECYHLFRNYFAMPPGWDFTYMPGYWKWFAAQSAEPAYQLHKRQIQILQWYSRNGHWVLKSPQHLAGLPALLKVYPDARIVYTHRDPVEVVASYCSLLTVAWGMISEDVDLRRVGQYVLETMSEAARVAAPALRGLPDRQIFHVAYADLVRDPARVGRAINGHFAFADDAQFGKRIDDWLTANPRNAHGRHRYALADFGLTEGDVRRALQDDQKASTLFSAA